MTPDRAEFWLVWLARGGIGLAVLFILAVILGLLRMAWNLGRSILVKRIEASRRHVRTGTRCSLRDHDARW